MTIRLDTPALDDTGKLLEQVLVVVIREDSRVLFLTPAGMGPVIVQRLRMRISRKRAELRAGGKRPKQFTLRASYHNETHNGIRKDACVLWREVYQHMAMSEELEGLLGHG